MASFTPKYKLEKPAPEDFYDITVFNANMDKVEEALGGQAGHDRAACGG